MPDWLIPLIVLSAFLSFIVFAFRQGDKVKPRKSQYGDDFSASGLSGPGGDGGTGGHSSH
jgi:hypothetical protein